ncbi:hypothetical protein D9M71_417610 [compost metagenome]
MLLGGQVAQLVVRIGGCLLDHRQGDDQFRVVRQRHTGQAEVVHGAQGLDAVVGIGRYFKSAEQVFLDAERCNRGHDESLLRETRQPPRCPVD